MKRSYSIIIWIVVLAVLLTASYIFYSKNKSQIFIPPIQQNTGTQDMTEKENSQQKTSGENDTESAESSGEDTSSKTSATNEAPDPEKIMVPDFALKDIDGNETKLSDYQGKIVVLNFWAVWCTYCKLEMPDLNELNQELEKEGDAVILAVDVMETHDVVSEYLDSENINLKVLMDEDGSVAATYGIEGYPTTFILNPDGSLYGYIPGATDKKTLEMLINKIRNGEPLK